MRIASDVEAVCGRCGEVWHVVIALAEGRAAQVECKECGARHRYRPVGRTPAAVPSRAAARAAGAPRARSRARAGRSVIEADLSRPSRTFSANDTYQPGDRVLHARFGEGVVQAVRGPKKVEVLFDAGPKTLVQGRGGR